jgi:ATP-dependent Clp protease ATP-binding subunit ClpA
MFEGLTEDAAHALVLAQHEATRAGQDQVGCGHLLVALATDPATPAGLALNAAGLNATCLRPRLAQGGPGPSLDAGALASVGIDLDSVRRATDAAFGPGALERGRLTATPTRRRRRSGRLPLNAELKRVLELALLSATSTPTHRINPGHLLLALLGHGDNLAVALLLGAGADLDAIRADVLRRVTPAA